jgi:pimeloyl-ACP methyl ester carboxylesterase/uncharacterized membrane protein HdeD (DUF308 family)
MNIKLHVRQDIGSGPPLILLHGIFADGTQWQTIADILKKDYRVIVVDLLGHGKSPRDDSLRYTPDEHSDALKSTLVSLGLSKNITVVGYSMGGTVAVAFCAKYPEGIEQIYSLSSPFYLNQDQMIRHRYSAATVFTKLSQWFYGLAISKLGEGRLLHKFVGYADNSKAFHKMIGANDNKLDAKIIQLNLKNMIRDFDFAGNLSKITAPITFYAGKKDLFIVQSQIYALKQFNPNMDIHRLDLIKVDHMLVQNLPKEITQLITINKQNTLHVAHDEGSGKVLVLLHGIESSSVYWDGIIPTLKEHNRVIVVDLLGFGKSPKPQNIAYSLEDQVQWLARTLNGLGVNNVTLAGHSLGSLVALAYSAAYPNKVDNLIMFSPVLLPNKHKPRKYSVKGLIFLRNISRSEISFFYSQLAGIIGEKQLHNYLPSIRSVENAIYEQNSENLAKKASSVPTKMYFGSADPLVDESYIKRISKQFDYAIITPLAKKTHNFPIFNPEVVTLAIDGDIKHRIKPKKSSVFPPNLSRQLAKLAVPVLTIKSAGFLLAGLLLFSEYAAATLVLGLCFIVVHKSYGIIRGAFSLKNEGLSYIGYVFLSIIIGVIGYGLFNHPETSLKISVYIISGLFLVAGMLRILVGLKWTSAHTLKRQLIMSGSLFLLLGMGALSGGVFSIYIIVYTIAGLLLVRGLQYSWFAMAAFAMAYIRSFNNYNK